MRDSDLRAKIAVSRLDGVRVTTTQATTLPARFDWDLVAGQTLTLPVSWFDESEGVIDLASGTAYSARLVARKSYDGTAELTLSSATGSIVLGDSTPNLTLSVAGTVTATYANWLRVLYDLEVTTVATGAVRRLLEGTITLRKEVGA